MKPTEMKHQTLSKERFLALLDILRAAIQEDDSFGGSLEYEATDRRHVFEVRAFIRTGNSQGQGGSIVVGETESENHPPR